MNSDDKPFSVRMGIVPLRAVHTEGWDQPNLLRLKDALTSFLHPQSAESLVKQTFGLRWMTGKSWVEVEAHHGTGHVSVFSEDVDDDSDDWWPSVVSRILAAAADNGMWAALLDFSECMVVQELKSPKGKNRADEMIRKINGALRWVRGYYMRDDGMVVPLFTPEEAAAIEASVKWTPVSVRRQMEDAVALFSNREKPDYGAAAHKAMNAAWAAVKICTGEDKFGVGVQKLRKSGKLPSALATMLGNLYGFASKDGKGMRHPEHEGESPPDMATARFVVVTCASFINYMAEGHPDKFIPSNQETQNDGWDGGFGAIQEDIPF